MSVKKPTKKTNRTIYYDDLVEHLPEVLKFSEQLNKEQFASNRKESQRLTSLLLLYQDWFKESINPHLSFDDCIAKVEKLGTKQQVKVNNHLNSNYNILFYLPNVDHNLTLSILFHPPSF
jgi:hypothetical protein